MYIQFQRTQPYPFLTNFDSPEFRAPECNRERSNTPLQALNLLNDRTFAEAWQGLAMRVLAFGPSVSFADRLGVAFQFVLGREPTEDEARRFSSYLAARQDALAERSDSLLGLPEVDGIQHAELAAWTGVGRILMNLDEFVIRP